MAEPATRRLNIPTLPALTGAVFRHWRREQRTLRQGLIAVGICVAVTVVAGVVLGTMEGLLERLPGLLVMVPAAIGMRGAVFGAMGARLGTGILTGQYTGAWTRDSFVVQNIEAAMLLTAVMSGVLAVLARATAAAFGLETISLWALMVVSMLGAILSGGAVLAGVVLLTRMAAARDWDMDAIGVPLISALGDISTLPALVVATLALGNAAFETVAGAVLTAGVVAAAVYGFRHPGALARRVIAESLPILMYAATMGTLAGTVLSTRLDSLIASPALLVVIPPFVAASGALGGILSARLASQLHLGLVRPHRLPDAPALLDGTLLLVLALAAFVGVGALSQAAAALTGLQSPGVVALVGVAVLGGMFATGLLFLVSYYAATTSYRFGLDPDNYGIPAVTATMDLLGILCLVTAIGILGIG